MKFAYNRFIRPSNTELPRDVIQRDSLENFEDSDCPEDSYEPLVAKRELKHVSLKIPGLLDTGNPTQTEFQVEMYCGGTGNGLILGYCDLLILWFNLLMCIIYVFKISFILSIIIAVRTIGESGFPILMDDDAKATTSSLASVK